MYSLFSAVVACYFLVTGYFVWQKNTLTDRSHIAFLVLCITTFAWQATWAVLFQVSDPELSNLLARTGYLLIIFLPTSLYQFLAEISQASSERRYVYISYAVSLLLAITLLTTDLFVSGYYEYYWGHYPKAGLLHPIHILQTMVVVMRGLYITLKKQQTVSDPLRSILRCCKISVLIYFFAAADYLCNYGIEFYPPGILFIATSLTIIAYAMVKKDLFDIRIVISRSSAYMIVWTLIALTFIVANTFQTYSMRVTVIVNIAAALIWSKYGERLRQALQTAAERKWITDWYNPNEILNALVQNLYGLLEKKTIIQEVAKILKDSIAVKDARILIRHNSGLKDLSNDDYLTYENESLIDFIANQSDEVFLSEEISTKTAILPPEGIVLILRSPKELEGVIVLGNKLSEIPYTTTDKKLLTTISRQTNVFLDRANAHEQLILEAIANEKEKNNALQSLAGSIAHEMRNPLSQIHGSLQLIQMQSPDLNKNQYIGDAYKVIQNGLQVIDLTMDAIAEKPIDTTSFKLLSALDLARESVADFAYREAEHASRVSVTGGDFKFMGDPVMVKYVLYNLITNALYYVKVLPHAEIIIAVMPAVNGANQIEVRDTGPGIESEAIPKLFDSFYTSDKQGGTGLGLSYCKRTMTALGGDIHCESELGKYTAFTLSFPKVSEDQVSTEKVSNMDKLPTTKSEYLAGKTLLIAEDDRTSRMIVKSILDRQGIQCLEAENGQEALNLLAEHHCDLILTDIQMPVMNGLELIQSIRQRETRTSNTPMPIIALTSEEGDILNTAIKLGVNDYLVKPVSVEGLVPKLQQLLAS